MISSKLLSEVAVAFVEQEDFTTQVGKALGEIGTCFQFSRTYIFLDGKEHLSTCHGYEWCAQGIVPFREFLEDTPPETLEVFRKILEEKGEIFLADIATFPEDLYAWLEPRATLSLLIYPLMMNGHVAGFIGFEDCLRRRSWTENTLDLLRSASEIIGSFCANKIKREQLRASESNFRRLFETVDDFIVVADLEGKIIFTNPAVPQKLGFTPDELSQMAILDLHPSEKADETAKTLGAMFRQERNSCPLYLRHKESGHLMVETRVWLGQWNGQDCVFFMSKDLSKEQEALQKFTRIFENAPVAASIICISDRKFTDVNAAFLEKLGYEREEAIGKTVQELAVFVDDHQRPEVAEQMLRLGSVKNVEIKIRCKDGSVLDGLLSGVTIENQGEMYFLTFMADITEQVALRNSLASQSKRLQNIIDGARLGTWEWNIQTGEMVVNERWAHIVGYSLAELEPISIASLNRLTYPEDMKKSGEILKKHFAGELDSYDCELRMRCKNNSCVWVHSRGRVVEWSQEGKPVMMFGTHTDITERKALEDHIIQISIRDSLTGVYNRRYVFERLEEIFAEYDRRGRNFSIAIMDIDHFKRVNDTYGHLAGDYILKEFAAIVSSSVRAYDLVGRYGGEEFIMVSVNSGASETISVIERIMNIIRSRVFVYQKAEICFTFSCGMADGSEFSAEELSIEKMVGLADQRLYAAKEGGRDRLVAPRIYQQFSDRNNLRHELEKVMLLGP
jgi:diguanylate cyclase (GGDEF)-like protein/PAS domain S-box-containing protein